MTVPLACAPVSGVRAADDRPLGILHVLAPGVAGGLETVVRLLASGQRKAGHRVHVAAVGSGVDGTHPFVAALAEEGVPVSPVEAPGRAYLRERAGIADLCRRLTPDVVHCHGYRPDIVDSGVARRARAATVSTAHGFTGGDWKMGIYERLQVRALRQFDAVVAVSGPLAGRLAAGGVPADRLHILPNAYDAPSPVDRRTARTALGIPSQAFSIGWVGRLSHEKGPDVMVAALARAGMPEGSLVSVIGDGPDRSKLVAQAQALCVEDRIAWHGTVIDAARLVTAFDVLVLSSRTEGTPMVLLEAMAAGVPIVTTRVGGVPDMLSEAEALLVRSGDPAALATAVGKVRAEPHAAAMRAHAARERLRAQFDPARWLADYDLIYRRTLASRQVPTS